MANAKDPVDVLIVGSGASGGPFAWQLSTLPGLKIVCLEQGDWVQKPGEPTAEASTQRQRLTAQAPAREGVKYNQGGYPYDYTHSYWQPVLGNAVGGATLHYAAVWARFHPFDFIPASLDGVGDDWPIRYWDLAPYYDLDDRKVGVAGVAGNPLYPAKPIDLLPPTPLSRAGQTLSKGFEKLGWHWWPTERAVITVPFNGRQPCSSNCTSCDHGCPREAKNSSDVVFWPEAIKNGVELRTRSTVREILVNKAGQAQGVVYYDADGHPIEQRARIVVLACNGIGTPRLLLNSKSSRFPRGLANSSGLVGKGLMGHPKATVVGVFEDDVSTKDIDGVNLACDEFCVSDPSRGFVRGFWIMSGAYSGPIDVALGEDPSPVATAVPVALRGRAYSTPLPWGREHHDAFAERYHHSVGMSVYCDELPEDENRIELDPTLVDDFGIPAPKLFYRRGDNTERMLGFGIERCKQLMQAAGAQKISSAQKTVPAPGHYLGTARMGNDPERSVVDKWCRAHDVKNLFIIDGSVFATSGGGLVPTSTIQAIALRTADYVKKNAKHLIT